MVLLSFSPARWVFGPFVLGDVVNRVGSLIIRFRCSSVSPQITLVFL
jgi:hypothetical protein